jgi:hypothetical protein
MTVMAIRIPVPGTAYFSVKNSSLVGVDDTLRRHGSRRGRRPTGPAARERDAIGEIAQRIDHLAQHDDGLA